MWGRMRALAVAAAVAMLVLTACGATERDSTATESELTFTATTVDGAEFDAADLSGRPVVFWFWAPWCSTCVAEAPHLIDLASGYGDAVSVVGVASLGGPDEMKGFIDLTETHGLTHLNDEAGEVWRHFEIAAQSTFAVVDASGQTTYAGYLTPEELADRVAELVVLAVGLGKTVTRIRARN